MLVSPAQTAPDGWKNSVRHNLSLNKCFEKVENKMSGSSRKGCLWALNLARIDKMEEEMHKWKRKDLAAIRRSMANPGEARCSPLRRPPCSPAPPASPQPAASLSHTGGGHGCLGSFPPPLHALPSGWEVEA